MTTRTMARRQFVRFLAASPLFAGLEPGRLLAATAAGAPAASLAERLLAPITAPEEALDVFDFKQLTKQVLPPAHYGFMANGTDGNETLRANRAAFEKVYLRPRRMVDTSNIDTRLALLGQRLSSPIVLAPVGGQRVYHPDAELASARAARSRDHLQILSNGASVPIEDVIAARGEPVWFQLYPTSNWTTTTTMVKRAEKAGAGVMVLTVDHNSPTNRVGFGRYARADERDCGACHDRMDPIGSKPMFAGTGATKEAMDVSGMTWEFIGRLRSISDMKVVIKGIVTAEDAGEAVTAGVDAMIVSNHGGRAEASGRGSLESLPEVIRAVDGRVPVLIDSGFRRGTDIFKALAMGAQAVCIGRPYIWGLASFGQAGVERVLDILRAELVMVMKQMGCPSLQDIGPDRIGRLCEMS